MTYEGDTTYTYASTSSSFEVVAGNSFIELVPELQEIIPSGSPVFTATLTNSAGLPLTLKPVALTLDSGGTVLYTSMATTDYAGRARWQLPIQAPGEYTVTVRFGQPITQDLDLSNPYYLSGSSTASLIVSPIFDFSGFYSPVDNPPGA